MTCWCYGRSRSTWFGGRGGPILGNSFPLSTVLFPNEHNPLDFTSGSYRLIRLHQLEIGRGFMNPVSS